MRRIVVSLTMLYLAASLGIGLLAVAYLMGVSA